MKRIKLCFLPSKKEKVLEEGKQKELQRKYFCGEERKLYSGSWKKENYIPEVEKKKEK